MVEKEYFFFSIFSKHPRTDFHWTILGHMPISEPTTAARHELCCCPGRSETLAYSWSPRVGDRPTKSRNGGWGRISPRKPGVPFPDGGRVARSTELQTSTKVIWWLWAGHTRSPVSQFLFHCVPQLPQLFLLPRNSLFRNHKMQTQTKGEVIRGESYTKGRGSGGLGKAFNFWTFLHYSPYRKVFKPDELHSKGMK